MELENSNASRTTQKNHSLKKFHEVAEYLKYAKILREKGVCFDLGFDALNQRILMICGKFFNTMMLQTQLGRGLKYMITFLGDKQINYRILYLGTGAASESSDLVQDLILQCGKNTVDHLEEFVFVNIPFWSNLKFSICGLGV